MRSYAILTEMIFQMFRLLSWDLFFYGRLDYQCILAADIKGKTGDIRLLKIDGLIGDILEGLFLLICMFLLCRVYFLLLTTLQLFTLCDI